MKRQSRPFIVEVKKKRGESARQHSIWGNLDLAAIGAETAWELTKIEAPVVPVTAIDATPKPDFSQPSTSSQPLSVSEIIPDAGLSGVEPEPAAPLMAEEPPRNQLSRRRRMSAEHLPRGERWKRRLPKVLRKGK
ncbi:hypothetical protein [Mesorhizobium sp. KR9-304]|jgi:hypothetical protein|uniref:hypothetical protein n=1 Tax=Mesorhizobium sp. KR9-304 TaxID=3156614 RepID=UPI0032B5E833